jgi:hypothetical protein
MRGSFSFCGLGLMLLGAVLLAAFISGLALLIVGLVKKRRGVWIGGLVTFLISLGLLAMIGIGLLVLRAGIDSIRLPY